MKACSYFFRSILPSTEYLFIFMYWIVVSHLVNINIAHGLVCRRICVGTEVHERHVVHVSGELMTIADRFSTNPN